MKNFIFGYILLLAILSISDCKAQLIDSDRSVLDNNNLPGFIKEKKPEVSNPYAKNYYLSNSWLVGSVDLADGSKLTDVLLKYDVVKHIVEIKKEDDVYLVSAKSVNDFEWFDIGSSSFEHFETTSNYHHKPDAAFGFFQVLAESRSGQEELKLLGHHSVWMYPATAAVSLSGSHRSNEIIWSEAYYLYANGELYRISEKRKENYELFGDYQEAMSKYIRNNGFNFKKERNVMKIFTEYFSLYFAKE